MELYGSLHNISGSVTASAFSGSFKGDGGGLYNLPASGVTGLNLSQIASGNATASISSTGFTVNTDTTIQGNLSVTGSITATNYIVSSSVTYMTTSFASGSSAFGNDGNDVHQFTGSVQITGSISLNGQAIGTGKLDETTFQSYTSSISSSIGSLSSSIALTDVSQSNRLTTIEGNYATTGSNLFKGNQTISGSIIPSVDNTYDLGSVTHQWKDVYISSGSLYIDGTKVLGSTSQELTITTDTGQSIKILEGGSDSIILQSADGDIELKSSGGGDILFDPTNGIISIKGTTQIQDGFKITSSGGTNIVFGDSIIVSGSIELTGNVDGIDLQSFSSSVSASISSLLGGNTSLSSSIATTTSGLSSSINSLSSSVATTTSGLTSTITSVSSSLTSSIGSLSSSVATTTSGLSSSIGSLSSSVATTTNDLSSSVATTTLTTKNRVDSIETTTGSLNTFTSSASGRLSSLETASGSIRTDFNTYTGSNNTTVSTQNGRLTSIEGITGSISSLNTYTGSNNTVIGTLQTSTSSLNSYTSSNTTNIDAIHTSTGSFKSFTSSFDTAFGMSGADVTVKGNLTVSGTQTTVNSTTVAIGDNIIQLNGTGATNAGLVVRDATAPNTVSGSFLWDSTNDKWIAGALGSEDEVVLKTATQTLTNKTISGASNTLSNIGNGSLTNSSITIAGASTSLGGTISAATILSGTGTVSGSVQIDLTATTNYASGILTRLNAVGVFSGSAQVTGIGNAQLTNSSVTVTAGTGMSGGGAVSLGGTVTLTNAGVTSITTNTGLSSNVSATGAVTITNTITNNNQLTNGAGYITSAGTATNVSGIVAVVNGGTGASTAATARTNLGLAIGSDVLAYRTFGTAAASATGDFATATQGTTADNALPKAGGALTGPLSITGNGTYLGDWGYGTLTLNDNGGYPGILFRNSGNIWMLRRNGADNGFDFAYSTNATAQGTGTFTQQGKWLANGNLYVKGQIYVGGNGASTGTQVVYNSGSWAIDISGNAATATSATSAASASTVTNGVYTNVTNSLSNSLWINSGADVTTLAGILTLYSTGNATTSQIMFKNTTGLAYGNHGAITGTYNTYFVMDTTNRGWIFRNATTSANVASISNTGVISATTFAGALSGNADTVTNGVYTTGDQSIGGTKTFTSSLGVGGAPTVKFHVTGTNEMARFENTSATADQYVQVNFRAGTRNGYIWVANQNSTSWAGQGGMNIYTDSGNMDLWTGATQRVRLQSDGHLVPFASATYNLGSSGLRWANIYTNDLHLSNDGKEGGNIVDGTTGDWTIQEGQENLYIINNKNGKKFKIDLTEIE